METEALIYRAFAQALIDRIAAEGDEIKSIAAALEELHNLEGIPLPKATAALEALKKECRISWDPDDPQQAAAREAFPDEKALDAERYLQLACAHFDIVFDRSEGSCTALLQAIADGQVAVQEDRQTVEKLKAERVEEAALRNIAEERAKELEAQLGRTTAMLRDYAGNILKIGVSDDDMVDDVLSKMRAAQTAVPATSGYCDAILRSIARKCDVENVTELTREELVQQITDVLDARLIPKGMRLRKVRSR